MNGGCCGHDHMVVGFTATFAISAYPHWSCEFKSPSDEVSSMQYYVIKFVSDLRQVGGFLKVLTTPVSSTNKTDHHNITEILLKVAINTITITQMNSLERNLILHLNHCQPRKINWFSCFRLFVLFPWQQQPF